MTATCFDCGGRIADNGPCPTCGSKTVALAPAARFDVPGIGLRGRGVMLPVEAPAPVKLDCGPAVKLSAQGRLDLLLLDRAELVAEMAAARDELQETVKRESAANVRHGQAGEMDEADGAAERERDARSRLAELNRWLCRVIGPEA